MLTDQEKIGMPAEEGDQAPGTSPRILLLSLNYRPSDRVLAYAAQLSELGVRVDLVVPDRTNLDEIPTAPGVRVHPVMPEEKDLPIRRAERFVIYRVPGRALSGMRRVTGRYRVTRPIDAALALAGRGHGKLAKGFHQRLFIPFYRQARPWLLARRAGATVRRLDVGSADRIVAGDVSAVPLGWRLARRYRQIPATTAMDLAPFADENPSA
ncbi:hypothetical protein [Micromonospora sp. NPDC007230]|uniref:hypothetical protein n=1 Tax=Micromonospora sp. NPDC007230 TaxID=3364237 RepID=UPI0036951875